jgi:hypothetical protein
VELDMADRIRHVLVGVWCLALTAALSADTLVMRDGRRVQGQLIAVRDGVIEFEGQRGLFGGRERVRVDREDVARIELDDFDRERDRGDAFGGSSGGGRPSGMREREIYVSSIQAWTDVGVTVRAGQEVYFSASGRVRWGPGRQDGPSGENGSPRNDARPIPSRPAAALIGRIGDGDDLFFIGAESGGIRMRSSGRLYLGINDDMLGDNSGTFRVTIFY